MTRRLLEERFQLAIVNTRAEQPIYRLVLARSDGRLGPQLQPATARCRDKPDPGAFPTVEPSEHHTLPPERQPCLLGFGGVSGGMILAIRATMTQLSDLLSSSVLRSERKVVDHTGLNGEFQIQLEWSGAVEHLPTRSPWGLVEPLPVLNGDPSAGMFAQALMTAMPDLPVEDEERLRDPRVRASFLARVAAVQRG